MKLFRLTVLYALFTAPPGVMAGDETGAQLYAVYCTQCHGTEGNGRGVNAAHMSVLPRSHIDPVEMGARQDSDLFKVIQQGGPSINKSVLMPAWGDKLSDEQVEKLVRYLRVMCCGE
jgi:cytochrome c oxidase cbb3-type subunit 3